MTAGADLRLLRAAVFTAVCVALSAAGHMLAAGTTLPLWALGTGFALVFTVAASLAGRERSLPGIAVALGLGQLALHALFSCGHRPVPESGRDPGGLRTLAGQLLCNDRVTAALTDAQARRIVADAGLAEGAAAHAAQGPHAAPGVVPGGPGTVGECLRAAVDTALGQLSGPMFLGHLLAAVAAGWLLHRGEAALWRLVRISADALTVRALRRALGLALALLRGGPAYAVLPPRVAAVPWDRAAPARSRVLAGAATRRGPPGGPGGFALAA